VSVPTTADTIDENNEDFSIASGTASATGTINDNDAAPTVGPSPASATEGSPAVFEFSLSNPSAVDTTYTFTFNGTAGSADYTTTSQTVTVPAGATTGTVCTNNCDTIAESNETFTIASGTASATGTINDDAVQL
jgi:hypothetical protein